MKQKLKTKFWPYEGHLSAKKIREERAQKIEPTRRRKARENQGARPRTRKFLSYLEFPSYIKVKS